jgi:hypothetical protein
MRRHALLLAVALVIPGCDSAASDILGVSALEPAAPPLFVGESSREQQIVPFAYSGVNPCTGEPFHVSGEMLIVRVYTFDAHGARATFITNALNITGVGEDGTVYRAIGGSKFHLNNNGPHREEDGRPKIITFNITHHTVFMSQDGASKFIQNVVFHITVDADGNWLAEAFQVTEFCTGQA